MCPYYKVPSKHSIWVRKRREKREKGKRRAGMGWVQCSYGLTMVREWDMFVLGTVQYVLSKYYFLSHTLSLF